MMAEVSQNGAAELAPSMTTQCKPSYDAPQQSLIARLEAMHEKIFRRLISLIKPLAGASALLDLLQRRSIPFAIATNGDAKQTRNLLRRVTEIENFPIVTGDDVETAKPAPDLFEIAISKLAKTPRDCFIVGGSVCYVLAGRRISSSVIALRSGGFDAHELQESEAYRVYVDPLELA